VRRLGELGAAIETLSSDKAASSQSSRRTPKRFAHLSIASNNLMISYAGEHRMPIISSPTSSKKESKMKSRSS